MDAATVKHYFPWGVVGKDSVSTPVRVVMDGQMSAVNKCLAKGKNSLNYLLDIHIIIQKIKKLFSQDISKMYNHIHMFPEEYTYMRVLYVEDLNPANPIVELVYVTWTYGLAPAGNIAESVLRRAAAHAVGLPLGRQAIIRQTYMDDTSGGDETLELAKKVAQESLQIAESVGFPVKYQVFSGEDPTDKASKDGVSCGLLGYRWLPKSDMMSLGCGEMNFNKSKRGVKKAMAHNITEPEHLDAAVLPQTFTKRMVLGKLMEVWDCKGVVEPLKVEWKLLFQTIEQHAWDAPIPDAEKPELIEMLKQMVRVRQLVWPCCVIPEDAKTPLRVDLLTCADGAMKAAGAGVWARVCRSDSSISCQLMHAKSALSKQTVPRNELLGLVIAVNIVN